MVNVKYLKSCFNITVYCLYLALRSRSRSRTKVKVKGRVKVKGKVKYLVHSGRYCQVQKRQLPFIAKGGHCQFKVFVCVSCGCGQYVFSCFFFKKYTASQTRACHQLCDGRPSTGVSKNFRLSRPIDAQGRISP